MSDEDDHREPDLLRGPGPEREAAISRMVFDVLDAGIVVQGPLGWIAIANPAAARILGVELQTLIGSRIEDLPGPLIRTDGSTLTPEELPGRLVVSTGTPQVDVVVGQPRDDGSIRWIEVSAQPLTYRGQVFAVVSAIRDVTERQRASDALRLAERRQRIVLQHAVGGYAIIADDGHLISGSDSMLDWLSRGLNQAGTIGFERVQDQGVAWRTIEESKSTPGSPQRCEVRVTDDTGSTRWIEMTATDQRADPAVGGVVVNYNDITERKQAEEALAHEAVHDPVTGLPNRRLLADRLSHALTRTQRTGSSVAVLFFDLDHFKLVNDSLGHPAGDTVLQQLAQRFRVGARDADTVVRFGGDEFVVICEDLDSIEQAMEIAARLKALIEEPILIESAERMVSVSVGIAFGGSDDEPSNVVRDADSAMNLAKERGRARIEVFSDDLRNTATRRLDLENALRRALGRAELHLTYQPIVSVETGRPVGCEALLRWDHGALGAISPSEFIPLAERSGVIVPIGAWVIHEAARQLAEWDRSATPIGDLWIAVNVSARQLDAPDLVSVVTDALAEFGLDPARLHLEVTESSLVQDVGVFIERLGALKALGVRMHVDDFGTGYSSLSYLKRLPLDSLKIDQSFTDGLGTDPSDTSIVDAIISLGRALDLDVIAEGVETTMQLTELRNLGCDFAQGYFWTKPLAPDQLLDWIAGTQT